VKIGAILRVFSKEPANVEATVARAARNVRYLKGLVDTVVVMVASDSDCGLTADALSSAIGTESFVVAASGSNSKEVLNRGFHVVEQSMCDIALVVSGKAAESLDSKIVLAAKMEFANDNVSAVGVTLDPELNQLIRLGFVQNTCSFWRTSHFEQIGGFTSERGVEEVSVLCELQRRGYSSVILQTADKELSVRNEDKERRAEILRTKWERIDAELARVGADREKVELLISHTANV
jgi:hypothetical protein